MSLPRIRDEFRVPARYGQRVYVEAFDVVGTITGCIEYGGTDYITVTCPDDVDINVHPRDLTYLKAGQ